MLNRNGVEPIISVQSKIGDTSRYELQACPETWMKLTSTKRFLKVVLENAVART